MSSLKKTGRKLELLADYDRLLMTGKGTRGGICHAIYRYTDANNKYIQNYNTSIEFQYLMYLDANSFYGWAMFQKLPISGFK